MSLPDSIPTLVYDWAERWPPKEYNGIISPSSLGGCMRAHYLKVTGEPPTTPPGPGALLNFELGRMWEEPIEKALRHAQVPFISQVYLEDARYGIGGTLDVALYDRSDNAWELVSIKTESINASRYRGREGQTFIGSHPEYAIQEATYKYLMEVNGYRVKDRARYLIVTKDNGWLSEDFLEFTPDVETAAQTRMFKLREALNDQMMPDCECEGWKIGYCSYGNPETREENKTGKLVNTECCHTWH